MQKLFLPSSDGLYKVGHSKFQLVNAAHPENSKNGTCRSFDVYVWYPADESGTASPTLYLKNVHPGTLATLNAELGTENVQRFLMREATSSYQDVDVSNRKDEFPAIIFCHDVDYMPVYYTVLMEHFASRGYFVFSVHHPSSVVKGKLWRVAEDEIKSHARGLAKLIRVAIGASITPQATTMPVRRTADYQTLLGSAYDTVFHDWAEDTRLLIDYVKSTNLELRNFTWNSHKFFASRLDLSKVVLVGHGLGGSVLQKVIGEDVVSAYIQLGGDQIPDSIFEFAGKPMLTITDASYVTAPQQNELNRCIGIENLSHDGFTDIPFYRHIRSSFDVDRLLSPRLAFNRIAGVLDPFISQYALSRHTSLNRAIL